MKTGFITLCFFVSFLQITFHPASGFSCSGSQDEIEKKETSKNEITSQLESIISYPKVLYYQDRSGIVVIQFQTDKAGVIGHVKVFSKVEAINTDLVRQLTGKKINIAASDALFEIHTVKIYFKMEG